MFDDGRSKNILVVLALLVAFTMSLHIKLNTFCIVAFSAFMMLTRFRRLRFDPLSILFCLYFLMHLIGMLYSENKADGWALVERSTFYLAFPLLMSACTDLTRNDAYKIFLAFVAGAIVSAILNVTGISPEESDQAVIYRVYIGMYLVMALVLLYGLWRDGFLAGKKSRIILPVMTLASVLLLVASQARMSVIIAGAFLLWIIFSASVGPKARIWVLGFLGIFVVAVILSTETFYRFVELFQRGDLPRWYNWQAAVSLIKENFLFGVGTGDALNALNTKRDVNWFEAFKTYNVHNQYLETFLRFGLVGFINLICILVVQARVALKEKDFFYISFLLIFSISIVTESMLCRNKGISFFSFFSGLNYLLVAKQQHKDQSHTENQKP